MVSVFSLLSFRVWDVRVSGQVTSESWRSMTAVIAGDTGSLDYSSHPQPMEARKTQVTCGL